VSPFNDRLGTYTISIRTPFPHGDAATLPRILSEAALLHYPRRFDIHKRPKPEPIRWFATTAAPARIKDGGIGWQRPTLLERAAQHTVSAFFARRADAFGVCITLEPGDPSARVQRFGGSPPPTSPGGTSGPARPCTLVISYLSPRFFTLLMLARDGQTALRRGRGRGNCAAGHSDVREFVASDEALFCEVFDAGAAGSPGAAWAAARLLRLLPGRRDEDEDEQARRSGAGGEGHGHGRGPHPLAPGGRVDQVGFVLLLCVLVAVEWAEELLWRVARVRWAVR